MAAFFVLIFQGDKPLLPPERLAVPLVTQPSYRFRRRQCELSVFEQCAFCETRTPVGQPAEEAKAHQICWMPSQQGGN